MPDDNKTDDTYGNYDPPADETSKTDAQQSLDDLLDTIPEGAPADDTPVDGDETDESQFVFSEELDQHAKSYGFTEDELSEFGSEGDLRLAMRAIDRQMADQMKVMQPPVQQSQQVVDPVQQQIFQQQAQQQQPATPEQEDPTQIPVALAVELDQLGEDDPVRMGIESLVQTVNSQNQQIAEIRNFNIAQQQAQQQDYDIRELQWFDQQLDGMDSELYGGSTNRTPINTQNRAAVYDLYKMQANQAHERRDMSFDYSLAVTRSANGVHGITKKLPTDKKRADAIRNRSAQRSATGRARGTSQPTERKVNLNKLSDDPDLMARVERIAASE